MALAESPRRGEPVARARKPDDRSQSERRPDPYDGFDDLYAAVEFQLDVHDRAYALVDEAFDMFARAHRTPRLHVRDHVPDAEFRANRQAELLRSYLAVTVTDLDEWNDSLTFHDHGQANMLICKAMLDWTSAHPDVRAQMEADGVFDVDRCLSPGQRKENEILGQARRFLRKCAPLVLERGYHRLMNINSKGGGAALGIDDSGERQIEYADFQGRRDA